MSKPKPGWQQPEIPPTFRKSSCMHLGLLSAAMQINRHAEGHVWRCGCGQEYMVVSNAGENKHFVKKEK